MATPSFSFTTTAAGGLLNVLKNQCSISLAFDPHSGGTQPPLCDFDAIWDTGATNSAITQAVIDKCGLAPTGMVMVRGVHGDKLAETYLVNIALPNRVMFPNVRVTKGDIGGADILIGMDIINKGDFAVTHLGGITKFSFRIPSQVHIDFVEESRKQSQPQPAQPRPPQPRPQHGGAKAKRPKHNKTAGKNKKK